MFHVSFSLPTKKVLPLMEDYLVALRSRDNTPAALLRMDRDHERQLIDGYKEEIQMRIKGKLIKVDLGDDLFIVSTRDLLRAERERERQEEKLQRVHQRKEEEERRETTAAEPTAAPTQKTSTEQESHDDLKIEVHATATHHLQEEPVVAHVQSHQFSHGQSVRYSQRQFNPKLNAYV
jgi:amyloid beta A4 protein